MRRAGATQHLDPVPQGRTGAMETYTGGIRRNTHFRSEAGHPGLLDIDAL